MKIAVFNVAFDTLDVLASASSILNTVIFHSFAILSDFRESEFGKRILPVCYFTRFPDFYTDLKGGASCHFL